MAIIWLAMNFGPPVELIYVALVAMLTAVVFISLFILSRFSTKISWLLIWKVTLAIPLICGLVAILANWVHDFITSPMTVRKYHIDGEYVINTALFAGKQTDWQYEHYRIKITNDTLYLLVMDNGRLLWIFKRPFYYTYKNKHTFIEFYDTLALRYDLHTEIHNSRLEEGDYRPLEETIDTVTVRVPVPDSVFAARLDSAKKPETIICFS